MSSSSLPLPLQQQEQQRDEAMFSPMNLNIDNEIQNLNNDESIISNASSSSSLSPFAFNNVTSRRKGMNSNHKALSSSPSPSTSASSSRRKLLAHHGTNFIPFVDQTNEDNDFDDKRDDSNLILDSSSIVMESTTSTTSSNQTNASMSYSLSPYHSPIVKQQQQRKSSSTKKKLANRAPLSPLPRNRTPRTGRSSNSSLKKKNQSSGKRKSIEKSGSRNSLKKSRTSHVMNHNDNVLMETVQEGTEEGMQLNLSENVMEQRQEVKDNVTITTKSMNALDNVTISFPSNEDKVTIHHKSLRQVYTHALQNGIHQRQLKESGCNLLSIDEVIIPTIIASKLQTIRTMIGKARGKKDLHEVDQLQVIRSILMSCSTNVNHQLMKYRNNQSMKREEERKNQKLQLMEQYEYEKKMKQEQKLQEKVRTRERRKREKKKNYTKNKELWREVMVLMTDLTKLEKEEKMWKSLDVQTLLKQNEMKTQALLPSFTEIESFEDPLPNHAHETEQKVMNVIDDISLATNRINDALSSVCTLIKESNSIRMDMYEKYKKDHKFYGYFGVNDPKALIRGLTL
jgi:hypothetical protein